MYTKQDILDYVEEQKVSMPVPSMDLIKMSIAIFS